jgi:hypothetical protein
MDFLTRSGERRRLPIYAVLLAIAVVCLPTLALGQLWSADQANQWYAKQAWQVGSNFLPSTAVNELEMWQPETLDPPTIDRELGWAQGLGTNTMRVFLHNLLWQQGSQEFLRRIDRFLQIAEKHRIRITFVLLDSVWDPQPHLGLQPAPRPHVHNSRWVQAPGAELLMGRRSS